MMRDNQVRLFVDFGSMPQENEVPQTVPPQESVESLFNTALSLQQQKKWDSALESYRSFLNSHSPDLDTFQASAVYHNMSTIAHETGDHLKAYVWSKKSLTLNPSNSFAKAAFEQFSKKFEIPSIPHQIDNFESFKTLLSKTPVDLWVSISLILILISLGLGLKKFAEHKKNLMLGLFIKTKKWPLYISLFLTILVITISYIAYDKASVTKAVVVFDKAPVQTVPGDNKPIIFEIPAGLELEALKSDQGFIQVRYAGAFSGWLKAEYIELLGLNFKHDK